MIHGDKISTENQNHDMIMTFLGAFLFLNMMKIMSDNALVVGLKGRDVCARRVVYESYLF